MVSFVEQKSKAATFFSTTVSFLGSGATPVDAQELHAHVCPNGGGDPTTGLCTPVGAEHGAGMGNCSWLPACGCPWGGGPLPALSLPSVAGRSWLCPQTWGFMGGLEAFL